jgi:hypothetical protein
MTRTTTRPAARSLPAPDPATRVPCPYRGPDTAVCPVHAPTASRMLIWAGPSQLDGAPVIVLATGVPTMAQRARGARSGNTKTGDMVQTYILRADVNPVAALRDGADVSICGVCPHKSRAAGGSGACYVNVGQGPNSAWKAHQHTGSMPLDLERLRGLKIRFGSYGDPAAVPSHVWASLDAVAAGVTGYTHQWHAERLAAAGLDTAGADIALAEWCMASADTAAEGVMARRLGYRSFIVRAPGEKRPAGAVVCPASAEGGKRTVCATCMACGGNGNGRRQDVTIIAHGSTAGAFKPSAPLVGRSLPLAVVA